MGKDQLLVISDKYGGDVKIIFDGECRFLVLDEDKQIMYAFTGFADLIDDLSQLKCNGSSGT